VGLMSPIPFCGSDFRSYEDESFNIKSESHRDIELAALVKFNIFWLTVTFCAMTADEIVVPSAVHMHPALFIVIYRRGS
jgi:hypothetical protein